ncbi:Hypothetical Protein FCC1311_096442 [Hondaea fermentalgiana]|uniref:Uncharacterized protein n=1 Tax=Hondaea fermentalgiana TaxID=2315210 RepID=A0A2R5GY94_9STRA|nr:Hypothetical Protein FCC1311_096442 [Hondaea fermentalgiana]|eukprot:GBG33421.1 Hypothetical Protein FCC1311_096442 [Hondaea fermentalgiana]
MRALVSELKASERYLCKGHNRIVTKFGKLTYGRFEEPYTEVHEIQLDNPDEEEEEAKIHKLTHDEIVEASKRLEQRTNLEAADTVVLERARQVWLRREQKGMLKKDPLSTEIIANILEPTFGINIAEQAPGRRLWLKESFQALMSLSKAPLSILVAMIGHRTEPDKARDVRLPLQEILSTYGGMRIFVPDDVNVLELLAPRCNEPLDPCPGEAKFLRIRYCLQGAIGEVSARIMDEDDFGLSEPIVIEVPPVASTKRTAVAGQSPSVRSRLTIIKALYGHSHDFLRSFNVTEKVQGLVDLRGRGQYLRLTPEDLLNDIFGDPTKAIERVFKVTFKVDAREGEILAPEAHGHLVNAVHVAAPIVGPNLVINGAKLSPKSTLGRNTVRKTDNKVPVLIMGAQQGESRRGRRRRTSVHDVDDLTLDVSDYVRAIIAAEGGDRLEFRAGENVFDALAPIANADAWKARFGAQDLLLHVELRANGILREIKLQTDPSYCFRESAHVDARPVTPSILIHAAIYGHPTDTSKQFNVQSIIEDRVPELPETVPEPETETVTETETETGTVRLQGSACFFDAQRARA